MLVTCTVGIIGSLLLLLLSKSYYLGLLARFLTGFFSIFFMQYFPVWVDTFSLPKGKQIWLKVLMTVPFIGMISGYALAAYFNISGDWFASFYIQTACLLPTVLGILITPERYLNIDEAVFLQRKQDFISRGF